jgi:hypothetical protein
MNWSIGRSNPKKLIHRPARQRHIEWSAAHWALFVDRAREGYPQWLPKAATARGNLGGECDNRGPRPHGPTIPTRRQTGVRLAANVDRSVVPPQLSSPQRHKRRVSWNICPDSSTQSKVQEPRSSGESRGIWFRPPSCLGLQKSPPTPNRGNAKGGPRAAATTTTVTGSKHITASGCHISGRRAVRGLNYSLDGVASNGQLTLGGYIVRVLGGACRARCAGTRG